MERGRRIAFDFGDSRIGVAVCDPDAILCSPLPFLDARHPRLKSMILALISEHQPVHIYLGLPRLLSGESGTAVDKVRDFAALIAEITEVDISFVDERLSTVSAQRKLHEAGKNSKESRLLIDSMAAVSILEGGLAIDAK